MSQTLGAEYADLLRKYHELADGIRMVRRAVDRAFRTGVLPEIGHSGLTPVEECEAVARAIYDAAARRPDCCAASDPTRHLGRAARRWRSVA
jgi:hypothetical protein